MKSLLLIPFAGLLLSIALFPLVAPHWWHKRYPHVVAAWLLISLSSMTIVSGGHDTFMYVMHAIIEEYLPFLTLIGSLYIVSGGLLVTGNMHGSPILNTCLLGFGGIIANFVGTIGASMLLIRPLIRANDERRHRVHTIIFFIFIVSNIGGSLTPLGDPPLFLGFLEGIGFFWPLFNLWPYALFSVASLLVVFFILDTFLYSYDSHLQKLRDPTPDTKFVGIKGKVNFVFLAVIVFGVLLSGLWSPGVEFHFLGVEITLQSVVRDIIMAGAAVASLRFTSKSLRHKNGFTFEPIKEVAIIFIGIFVTIIPVMAELNLGSNGIFASLIATMTNSDGQPINDAYFWLPGILSTFLDNAPTYLVFFKLASGDPEILQGPLAGTLAAMSIGTVFMGANSYVGNAPNFMVRSIANSQGVPMPGFFGYMLWSAIVLGPLYFLLSWFAF